MNIELLDAIAEKDSRVKRIKFVAWFMDARFKIPIIGIRFGLDPILGLIPGVGSIGTYLVSVYLIIEMFKSGASGRIVMLMMLNVLFDTVVGSFPVLGNIFDVFYKANNRNVGLLIEHYEEGKHQGSAWGVILLIILFNITITALLIFGVWKGFQFGYEWLAALM